jgi:hypothetical protein
MIHQAMSVPQAMADKQVVDWGNQFKSAAQAAGWPRDDAIQATDFAAHQVIGQAVNFAKQAKTKGKIIPIEYFYMLFSFANLDNIAFEIEEALHTELNGQENFIFRSRPLIRRTDLILDPAQLPPARYPSIAH